jgi:hypothetical protein
MAFSFWHLYYVKDVFDTFKKIKRTARGWCGVMSRENGICKFGNVLIAKSGWRSVASDMQCWSGILTASMSVCCKLAAGVVLANAGGFVLWSNIRNTPRSRFRAWDPIQTWCVFIRRTTVDVSSTRAFCGGLTKLQGDRQRLEPLANECTRERLTSMTTVSDTTNHPCKRNTSSLYLGYCTFAHTARTPYLPRP